MSRRPRTLLLLIVSFAMVTCATSAFFLTRASIETASIAQTSAQPPPGTGPRNLFMQPEARRVAQRLGKRFNPFSRATSVITGSVTLDNSEHPLTLTRRQSEKGENVELVLATRVLTWRAEEGARAVSSTPTEAERLLIERLIYDSPDYFVLAQLQGASYFTIAQNVRPENAPDNYDGPVWNVVRVDHSPSNEAVRPNSSWRLYYLNSQTGLVDRIVSQLNDETVETEISGWSEWSGEKVPSHIIWSIGGRTVMSYQVNFVSHNE